MPRAVVNDHHRLTGHVCKQSKLQHRELLENQRHRNTQNTNHRRQNLESMPFHHSSQLRKNWDNEPNYSAMRRPIFFWRTPPLQRPPRACKMCKHEPIVTSQKVTKCHNAMSKMSKLPYQWTEFVLPCLFAFGLHLNQMCTKYESNSRSQVDQRNCHRVW